MAVALLLHPYELPVPVTVAAAPAAESIRSLPSEQRLAPLFVKRYFSKPKQKPAPVATRRQPVRQIRWPAIQLDCVFIGKRSQIAVLKSNQKSFTCRVGDKFLGVVVNKIRENEVELTFQGGTKVVQTSGESKSKKRSRLGSPDRDKLPDTVAEPPVDPADQLPDIEALLIHDILKLAPDNEFEL